MTWPSGWKTGCGSRGITDPAAWLARPGRDLDASLAEAVTLSVDDVVLSGLLDQLSATPLATELVTGASVYRVPVDDTALAFQVGQPRPAAPRPRPPGPHPPHPASHPRSGRTRRRRPDLAGRRRADRGGLRPLPGRPRRGTPAAGRRAGWPGRRGGRGPGRRAADPGTGGDEAPLHFVHRWTAGAIAALHPDASPRGPPAGGGVLALAGRHHPAEPGSDDIDQLLEARYHHHAAGQADQAIAGHRGGRDPAADLGTIRAGQPICAATPSPG